MDTITTTVIARRLIRTIPREALPASAAVDALHMSANLKSAFRCRLTNPALFMQVNQWCEENDLAVQVDQEGFVCVARTIELATKILEVDRGVEPHELTLGLLLGYPSCCCEWVARVGESNIDGLSEQMREWLFVGEYRLIDPSGYLDGRSLICHLPCSPVCSASLAVARSALLFVDRHRLEPGFEQWSDWFCLHRANESTSER